MTVRLKGPDSPRALQQLARERMKLQLLTDIRTDLAVCEIEGWPPREYIADLHHLIAGFDPCPSGAREAS